MNETAGTHPETENEGAEMQRTKTRGQTELILPRPKNSGGELVCGLQREIRTQIPPSVDHQQFMAACVVEANKLPADTTPASVAIAVMNLGVLGLIPGQTLGHAYLVAFNSGKGQNRKRLAQVMVGYKGFIELALGNNFLKNLHAGVVTNTEEFRYWVDSNGPQIHHVPEMDRDPQENNIVCSYCVYQTSNGGHGVVVVPKRVITKAKSKNPDSDPWKYSYGPMAAKTAVRQASKEWRLTRGLAQAVMIDEEAERGAEQTQLASIALPPMGPEQATEAPSVGTRGERAAAVTPEDLDRLGERWEVACDRTGRATGMDAWKRFVHQVTDLPGDRITKPECWTRDDLSAVQAAVTDMEQAVPA